MKKIKITLLTFIMSLNIIIPTIATTSVSTTEYSEEITNESSQDTFVYVTQSSSFSVKIPKRIILSGEKMKMD